MASSGLVPAFLGALQASLSVLLTLMAGLIASEFNMLTDRSTREISGTCVRLLLPSLMIKEVGMNMRLETADRYLLILVWAIGYHAISVWLGKLFVRVLGFPAWTTAAVAFNNTTSLPLLLVRSLEVTGVLEGIMMPGNDSVAGVVARAKSYFLISAIVSNSSTFGLGPSLLRLRGKYDKRRLLFEGEYGRGDDEEVSEGGEEDSVEDGISSVAPSGGLGPTETTSLLPRRVHSPAKKLSSQMRSSANSLKAKLPGWLRRIIDTAFQFLNAPLVGAIIGAIIGFTPPLHRAFFARMDQGGFLNAWLTSAIASVGELFTALQVIVIGLTLGQSIRRDKAGEDSGRVPARAVVLISLVRYLIWPAVSTTLIWVLASKTRVLGDDPVLWFSMALMPAGPPVLTLTALADVTGSPAEEKLTIAKFLAIAYLISPLICIPVVGSLKAAEAAIKP